MRAPFWLDRLNKAIGFDNDERVQFAQGTAVRNAYLVLALLTLPLGAYLEYAVLLRGALGSTSTILLASLLVLGARRMQLGGLAATDERVEHMRVRLYTWPVLALSCGTFVYVIYRGAPQGMIAFPLYMLVGMSVAMGTRFLAATAQGTMWYWLACAAFNFGLFGWQVRDMLDRVRLHQTAGLSWTGIPDIGLSIMALGGLCVFSLFCLVVAWRRWREQRSTHDG